jgi:hypothetical protein
LSPPSPLARCVLRRSSPVSPYKVPPSFHAASSVPPPSPPCFRLRSPVPSCSTALLSRPKGRERGAAFLRTNDSRRTRHGGGKEEPLSLCLQCARLNFFCSAALLFSFFFSSSSPPVSAWRAVLPSLSVCLFVFFFFSFAQASWSVLARVPRPSVPPFLPLPSSLVPCGLPVMRRGAEWQPKDRNEAFTRIFKRTQF